MSPGFAPLRVFQRGRLSQHRGYLAGRNPGGGNHRASGCPAGASRGRPDPAREYSPDLLACWLDRRNRPTGAVAAQEAQIGTEVSRYIGAMPFLWLSVPVQPDRGYIERNSIALLSCVSGGAGAPSRSWLGQYAVRAEIRESGLWNVNHVRDRCEPEFLTRLSALVECHN